MEFAIRFFMVLLKYIAIIAQPIYWFLNRQRPPDIPPIKNPLLFLSAIELSKKIRNREVTLHSSIRNAHMFYVKCLFNISYIFFIVNKKLNYFICISHTVENFYRHFPKLVTAVLFNYDTFFMKI